MNDRNNKRNGLIYTNEKSKKTNAGKIISASVTPSQVECWNHERPPPFEFVKAIMHTHSLKYGRDYLSTTVC